MSERLKELLLSPWCDPRPKSDSCGVLASGSDEDHIERRRKQQQSQEEEVPEDKPRPRSTMATDDAAKKVAEPSMANMLTSLSDIKEKFKRPHGSSQKQTLNPKIVSSATLGVSRPQTSYGVASTSVPRSTGPGPPTAPRQARAQLARPPSAFRTANCHTPKAKVFSQRDQPTTEMLGASGSRRNVCGSSGVVANGLSQRLRLDASGISQVFYETNQPEVTTMPPARHQHLPNVSSLSSAGGSTKRKAVKKPPTPLSSMTAHPLAPRLPSTSSLYAQAMYHPLADGAAVRSAASSTAVCASGKMTADKRAVTMPSPLPPPPAHSRIGAQSPGARLLVTPPPCTTSTTTTLAAPVPTFTPTAGHRGSSQSADVKDAPLDLSRVDRPDSRGPVSKGARASSAVAALGGKDSTSDRTDSDAPLDLSVKKRTSPTESGNTEPPTKKRAVEVVGVCGKMKFTRPTASRSDASQLVGQPKVAGHLHQQMSSSSLAGSGYPGISFGKARVAPVGIATATTHSQGDSGPPRTPRPAHLPPTPIRSMSSPLLADLSTVSAEGRRQGRRSPIFPGGGDGRCAMGSSTRHPEVVNVRGKPFKVSTVRPQVNGRPVVTSAGNLSQATTTIATTTAAATSAAPAATTGIAVTSTTSALSPGVILVPPNRPLTVNGTIVPGPLGCLKLGGLAVGGMGTSSDTGGVGALPLPADATSGKVADDGTPRVFTPPAMDHIVVNKARAGSAAVVGDSQHTTGALHRDKPSSPSLACMESLSSEEESDSTSQALLLNIPSFKPSKPKRCKAARSSSSSTAAVPEVEVAVPAVNIPEHETSCLMSTVDGECGSGGGSGGKVDTQCVSISTQTVDDPCQEEPEVLDNESEVLEENEEVNVVETDSGGEDDDFPPPDEPIDLKDLYPTPSRMLMCARKSTTKQNKRLLQQMLESKSPPKLSVIARPANSPTTTNTPTTTTSTTTQQADISTAAGRAVVNVLSDLEQATSSSSSSPAGTRRTCSTSPMVHMPTLSPRDSPTLLTGTTRAHWPAHRTSDSLTSSLDHGSVPGSHWRGRGQPASPTHVAVDWQLVKDTDCDAAVGHGSDSWSIDRQAGPVSQASQRQASGDSSSKMSKKRRRSVSRRSADATHHPHTPSTAISRSSLLPTKTLSTSSGSSILTTPSDNLTTSSPQSTPLTDHYGDSRLGKVFPSSQSMVQGGSQTCTSRAASVSDGVAGGGTLSSADSESEDNTPLSVIRSKMRPSQSASTTKERNRHQGNIFEKLAALAGERGREQRAAQIEKEEEEEDEEDDDDASDELSLMCWEQMAASPGSEDRAKSPTPVPTPEVKDLIPAQTERANTEQKSSSERKGSQEAAVSSGDEEAEDPARCEALARALPRVANLSAFLSTTKTKLTPLHYASIRDSIHAPPKRDTSPVPIENTRFYQATILRGGNASGSGLSRSASSSSLEVMGGSSSRPSTTPRPPSRSSSLTPQPSQGNKGASGSSAGESDLSASGLEDWQIAHMDFKRNKLRMPAALVTLPRTGPKVGSASRRLSPEGLYDFCPSAQYGKAKACMTGAPHTPVFTPIRSLSTTTPHGLARLAMVDLAGLHPKSARTVAAFNRAREDAQNQSGHRHHHHHHHHHHHQRRSSEGAATAGAASRADTTLGDPNETWTMVKDVSPRKPGSPAAAAVGRAGKESSGTLVTVLRRDRSRDDSATIASSGSGSGSGSGHPSSAQTQPQRPPLRLQLHKERPPLESSSAAATTPRSSSPSVSSPPSLTLSSQSAPVRAPPVRPDCDHTISKVSSAAIAAAAAAAGNNSDSSESERPKLTFTLYTTDGNKPCVKIGHGRRKSSKSSRQERHRRCSYTIKGGEALETPPPAPQDPSSPQPKLSPIRLVASPPRRKKSSSKRPVTPTSPPLPFSAPHMTPISQSQPIAQSSDLAPPTGSCSGSSSWTLDKDTAHTPDPNGPAGMDSDSESPMKEAVHTNKPKTKPASISDSSQVDNCGGVGVGVGASSDHSNMSVVNGGGPPQSATDSVLPVKCDEKQRSVTTLKIHIDPPPQPSPSTTATPTSTTETTVTERNLSPIRMTLKSPRSSTEYAMMVDSNIISPYDMPTSPDLSADDSMPPPLPALETVKVNPEVPPKKKDKKASKKHKKEKRRENSKDRSKSESKKEKKEKRNKDRDKEKTRDKEKDKDRDRQKDRDKEKTKEKSKDKEKQKDKQRDKAEKHDESQKDRGHEKTEDQAKEKMKESKDNIHKKEKVALKGEASERHGEKSEKRRETSGERSKKGSKVGTPKKKEAGEKEKSEKKISSEAGVTKEEPSADKSKIVLDKESKSVSDKVKMNKSKSQSKKKKNLRRKDKDDRKSRRLSSTSKDRSGGLKSAKKGSGSGRGRTSKSLLAARRAARARAQREQEEEEEEEEEEGENGEGRKRKRRSLLDELVNSDGYVAEKRLEEKRCRDLYADPSKLGREERALLRAMMQFSEMEQGGSGSEQQAVDQGRSRKQDQTSARRKAQALTKSALMRARNRKGCTKKPKFNDFVPEILSARTRTQASELASTKKSRTSRLSKHHPSRVRRAASAPDSVPPAKVRRRGRQRASESGSVVTSGGSTASDMPKSASPYKRERWLAHPDEDKEKEKHRKEEPLEGDTTRSAFASTSEGKLKKRKSKKKKKLLLAAARNSLTMKLQLKSELWDNFEEMEGGSGRLELEEEEDHKSEGRLMLARQSSKQERRQKRVQRKMKAEVPGEEEDQEAGAEGRQKGEPKEERQEEHQEEGDQFEPAAESLDVRLGVKEELLEADMLGSLLRPDPMAAPSPAPSASTGMSTACTEEYWPVPECVKKMSVNQNTGETILHKAARLGYEDVARFCSQTNYVDLDARDHAGYTAMHECCSQGHLEVSELLIDGGASVNLASCDGMRPLHDAVENDLMEMVRLLLSRGADPKLATYSGKTVLGLTKNKDMLAFLTGYFQDLNGCRQPQPEIPWSFTGSAVCEDLEEESGFRVFRAVPENDPHDPDFYFEFSDSPPIQTFFLQLDPVKGATNYVSLDDVAERLGLTSEVFLHEHTSLPVPTTTLEVVTSQCQCLCPETRARLERQAARGGVIKMLEYSSMVRSLLDVTSERLADVTVATATEVGAGEVAVPFHPPDLVCREQPPPPEVAEDEMEVHGFDWNEQVEQFERAMSCDDDFSSSDDKNSRTAGSLQVVPSTSAPQEHLVATLKEEAEEVAETEGPAVDLLPTASPTDILRGLFQGVTADTTDDSIEEQEVEDPEVKRGDDVEKNTDQLPVLLPQGNFRKEESEDEKMVTEQLDESKPAQDASEALKMEDGEEGPPALEDELMDDLYLTAMGLDEGSEGGGAVEALDTERNNDEEIFFRKPY